MNRTIAFALLVLGILTGCGDSKLQPLDGRVVVANGKPFDFTGDTIEFRLENDPSRKAFGEIQPDGSFRVESLVDGAIVNGTQPGVYQARIVLSDDDHEHRLMASKAINKKYFRYETSGLTVDAPATGVTITVVR